MEQYFRTEFKNGATYLYQVTQEWIEFIWYRVGEGGVKLPGKEGCAWEVWNGASNCRLQPSMKPKTFHVIAVSEGSAVRTPERVHATAWSLGVEPEVSYSLVDSAAATRSFSTL